jgi:hypothetical protein
MAIPQPQVQVCSNDLRGIEKFDYEVLWPLCPSYTANTDDQGVVSGTKVLAAYLLNHPSYKEAIPATNAVPSPIRNQNWGHISGFVRTVKQSSPPAKRPYTPVHIFNPLLSLPLARSTHFSFPSLATSTIHPFHPQNPSTPSSAALRSGMIGTAAPPILGRSMRKMLLHGIRLHSPKNSIIGLGQRMILGLSILYAVQL